MQLTSFTWSAYSIPFRNPFITAHGVLGERTGAIVAVHIDTGNVGYGEIAPLPEFSGSSLTEALNRLTRLAHELAGREVSDILRFLLMQSEEEELPAPLLCGLETALLDALGKASGKSVAQLLVEDSFEENEGRSCPRASVPVNVVLSGETGDIVVKKARAAMAAGFSCLKLKVTEASRTAIECVEALRDAVGPEPCLRLDANEGWTFEQAYWMLTRCAPYDIQYVEQPLPARDLAGMARLRRLSPVPLAADEALSGLSSARRVLAAEAADVLILKPQLAGGLRACRRIIHEASQQRVACVITSALEAGIGVAAALHLAAASPEVTMACGLATLDLLESDLLSERLLVRNGKIEVPLGAGLGVQLDPQWKEHTPWIG